MGLLGWLKRGGASNEDRRLHRWREKWAAAVSTSPAGAAGPLRDALEALGLPEEEIEIEREMLDALERLTDLQATVGAAGLPRLPTGHRVVGADACHFTAPVSMPDEPSQPSGRLILTSARAIFVGGADSAAAPWHAVREAMQVERDLVLVRADRERLYRYRCNSYADALAAAFLARHLVTERRSRSSGRSQPKSE